MLPTMLIEHISCSWSAESVVVHSVNQKNAFTMVCYEDTSTAFTVRTNTGSYGTDGGLGGGGGVGAP